MDEICGIISTQSQSALDKLPLMVKSLTTTHTGSGNSAQQDHACFFSSNDNNSYSDNECSITFGGNPHLQNGPNEGLLSAENIALLYKSEGLSFLQNVCGNFALVIYDNVKNTVHLLVDRFGVYGLSYCRDDDGAIYFSTSTGAVSTASGNNEISLQSVFNYVYFHYVPSPQTIYSNVFKVEPSVVTSISESGTEDTVYWKPAFNDKNSVSFEKLSEETISSLRTAVTEYSKRENVGSFLSGGTDSSALTGLLREAKNTRTPSYSIGFSQDGYDEIVYARIAAKAYDTDQKELYVTPEDVASALPLISSAYDEPFGNSSVIPTYFCAKLAHDNGTKVLIAGDGGDEIFAGNTRYNKQQLFHFYWAIPKFLRTTVIEPLFTADWITEKLKPLYKLKRYIEQARIPMPMRMETYNFLHRTDVHEIFDDKFLNQINVDSPIQLLEKTYNRAPTKNLLHRMLYLDWKQTLADNDLRKVTKMCELGGVDVEFPFLHENVIDVSLKVPPNLKIKNFKLRYFYKKTMDGFLPEEIIKKTKHGFGLPFGEWLKTSPKLQDLVYQALNDLKQRGIFKPEFIDDIMKQHKEGHAAYYGTMVWILAMLEFWFQNHDVKIPTA